MIFWLTRVCAQLRESQDISQTHVADVAQVDQSTIWRFERDPVRWPKSLKVELFVAAYAEMAGIDSLDVWELAIEYWRRSGELPTVAKLSSPEPTQAGDAIAMARLELERMIADRPPKPKPAPARKPRTSRAKPKTPAVRRQADAS